jgi:hypothetical protein
VHRDQEEVIYHWIDFNSRRHVYADLILIIETGLHILQIRFLYPPLTSPQFTSVATHPQINLIAILASSDMPPQFIKGSVHELAQFSVTDLCGYWPSVSFRWKLFLLAVMSCAASLSFHKRHRLSGLGVRDRNLAAFFDAEELIRWNVV